MSGMQPPAGRGRGMTMPAWMKASGVSGAAPGGPTDTSSSSPARPMPGSQAPFNVHASQPPSQINPSVPSILQYRPGGPPPSQGQYPPSISQQFRALAPPPAHNVQPTAGLKYPHMQPSATSISQSQIPQHAPPHQQQQQQQQMLHQKPMQPTPQQQQQQQQNLMQPPPQGLPPQQSQLQQRPQFQQQQPQPQQQQSQQPFPMHQQQQPQIQLQQKLLSQQPLQPHQPQQIPQSFPPQFQQQPQQQLQSPLQQQKPPLQQQPPPQQTPQQQFPSFPSFPRPAMPTQQQLGQGGQVGSQSFPQLTQYQVPPPQQGPAPGQHPWPGTSQSSVAIMPPGSNLPVPGGIQSSSGLSVGASSLIPQRPLSIESDWQEHASDTGRKYYFNKKTNESSWEKPLELMTPTELADASTVWKEFTTSDGRVYYYNKITKESKWTMPAELKEAREQAIARLSSTSSISSLSSLPSLTPFLSSSSSSSTVIQTLSAQIASTSSSLISSPIPISSEKVLDQEKKEESAIDTSDKVMEDAKKDASITGKVNVTVVEDEKKAQPVEEQITYASKTEAKAAFKELLESVNVDLDWTWDQAMRLIINDKRYSALKTLGERKQTFNEYLTQKKKMEAEEKRVRHKKDREEFLTMLEECEELRSNMRWSKASQLFEKDPRFKAIEREREREELFDDYLLDLDRKEKEKAKEQRKKSMNEFRSFLETCDFIKVNTQWRKVQDRLEDNEVSRKLEKIDKLDVFQDYIRDLEKKEEEERQLAKEKTRRQERKNRDAFRKLMDEDKSNGILNARTKWKDYLAKVKDDPAYLAVATNSSGSTPKELFEDAVEELEKKYLDDKPKIKDIIKNQKINVAINSTFDQFNEEIKSNQADDMQLDEQSIKIVFEDLLDRAKEKEEKEIKRKQKLNDDFYELLRSLKNLNSSSDWSECKSLFEMTSEYKAIEDENEAIHVFDEYVEYLKYKEKKKEAKREEREKEKEKERSRDKDQDREKRKEKEKEKEKKHKKRKEGEGENEKEDKEKKSKKHSKNSEQKKSSKKHMRDSDSDGERREKKHKKERKEGRDLEEGELELENGLGEEREVREERREEGNDREEREERDDQEEDMEDEKEKGVEDGEIF